MSTAHMATKGNKNACKKEDIDSNNIDEKSRRQGIFLVNRGICTFVKKVRHVQEKEGLMAIIMDDHNEKVEIDDFIMADDGTGNDIHIPSALMGKQDSEIFRKYFMDHGEHINVTLKIDFNEYTKQRIVNYQLWISSAAHFTTRFIQEFKPIADLIK